MWQRIRLLFQIPDLRSKILFVLAMLAIFRIGANIPIPDVDQARLAAFFGQEQLFGLLNVFSGGALENISIMMLGVGPYITATIILQLLTMIFPKLKEMYYESGEQGRQKFNQYSRLLTIPLAMIQSYAFLGLLQREGVIGDLGAFHLIRDIAVVTAGSIFLMWLGELISEKGIGNGVSLIIFAGIIAGIPQAVGQTLQVQDIQSQI
ncbi:MAG: preprotein translocase subunit SecY, partial [Parcubacteria group bacterium]|nr:preprotein translocase subunit SecY [Parcubacteria group bacterium]